MPNIGVIHEQGFPVGEGLGFKPLSEQEKKDMGKESEDKDKR